MLPSSVCMAIVGPPGAFTVPRNALPRNSARTGRLVTTSPRNVSAIQLKFASGGTTTSMSAFTA